VIDAAVRPGVQIERGNSPHAVAIVAAVHCGVIVPPAPPLPPIALAIDVEVELTTARAGVSPRTSPRRGR
jgi:hypothetical protein